MTPPAGRGASQRSAEAGGSLIRGTLGRVGSSPDNGGTCRHDQTMRVRLARSEGVMRVNQWLKSRKATCRLKPGGYGPVL